MPRWRDLRPNWRALALACAAVAAVLAGCGDDGPPAIDAGSDAGTDAGPPPPPLRCRPGTPWDPALPAFVDRTDDYGLGAVRGKGLGVADLDGDGFADLVAIEQGSNARTDLTAMPPRYQARVLMNRPRDGGGRTFEDATESSQLLATRAGDGYGRVITLITFADVDDDGDVDAFSGYTRDASQPDTGDRSEILLNDGTGVFSLGPDLVDEPDAPQSVGSLFVDHDLDGIVDLFNGYHFAGTSIFGQQHRLLQGAGDGSFFDVTDGVGLTLYATLASLAAGTSRRPLMGTTACDVSGDGRTDLLGATYARGYNLLYVREGDHYVEVGRTSGVASDANETFTDDLSYRCWCRANPGMCSGVPPPPIGYCPGRGWTPGFDDQPFRLGGNTFAIACGDVDNDGDNDLYTAEIAHPDVGQSSDKSQLLVNVSDGTTVSFERPDRAALGLVPPVGRRDEGGLSNALFDFDGDGRLDAYFGGSDYDLVYGWLFRQNDDGTFTRIPDDAGFHHPCAHGMALADFDHDGDVDVVVGSSTARSWCTMQWMATGPAVRLYENVASEANWTSLRLVGRGAGAANTSAVGARVRVTAGGVTQTREVQGSWGHVSQGAELAVHFGLGEACEIDVLEILWPDAALSTETFTHVPANYRLEIRQGEGLVRYEAD